MREVYSGTGIIDTLKWHGVMGKLHSAVKHFLPKLNQCRSLYFELFPHYFTILMIFNVVGHHVAAQENEPPRLPFGTYIDLLMRNHPVMQQAALLPDYAKAEVRMARGAFDPVVMGGIDQKYFDGKEYFTVLSSALKVPTSLPFDPKVSVERGVGQYVNPQFSTSAGNYQIGTGVSLPIGRGLIMDERRAVLQQALAFKGIAYAEQIKMANYALMASIKDYYEWAMAYQELLLMDRSQQIAKVLFDRVLMDYSFGEASVVDTIQAKITLQTRMADFQQVRFKYFASGYKLSMHLWSDQGEPLELRENTIPDTLFTVFQFPDDAQIGRWLTWASENHPEILKLTGKMEQLEVESRLNKEFLKPRIDLSYTLLNAPYAPSGDWVSPRWGDNYKLGMDVYMPLFLRKERGKLALTNLKLQETNLEVSYQRNRVINNLLTKKAELDMSQVLVRQFSDMAANYERLLEAEFLNLETGESDLFKLNIQQDKYIESQMKYLKTYYQLEKLKMEILNDAGLPFLLLKDME